MASTRVRGITIELDADTSGISKGLKTVNSEIRNTQSQLKDVDRLLKLDPTNTQLLEQKQRLLKDAVGETKTKLDTLKKAQEEVGKTLKETGEGQEQYDALTREIVSCEQELKKAEKAASTFNITAAKISATADKVAAGLGKAADKTRGL
jgi:phage-related minor tail protein